MSREIMHVTDVIAVAPPVAIDSAAGATRNYREAEGKSMSFLFVARLRPFVLLAGVASLMLNLAMLVPSIYMTRVSDGVFSSRSVETLVMLSALAALALALGYCMDVVRAGALSWSGRALDRRLSPMALACVLRESSGVIGRGNTDALGDIAQLRAFLSGTGIHAIFDAPWLP